MEIFWGQFGGRHFTQGHLFEQSGVLICGAVRNRDMHKGWSLQPNRKGVACFMGRCAVRWKGQKRHKTALEHKSTIWAQYLTCRFEVEYSRQWERHEQRPYLGNRDLLSPTGTWRKDWKQGGVENMTDENETRYLDWSLIKVGLECWTKDLTILVWMQWVLVLGEAG